MKTFYTERDIIDMHAAGVTEIELDDDVIMTDLAREKAIVLGLHMRRVEKRSGQPASGLPRLALAPKMQLPPAVISQPASPAPPTPAPTPPPPTAPPATAAATNAELASHIKSAIIARLGTSEHNDLLDIIIPQVLARLNK